MRKKVKQIFAKRPALRKRGTPTLKEAFQNIPRITNETVAEHREEVLSGARKLIYPLQHSRRRIIAVSVTILTALIVSFFVFSLLALYRFDTTSAFMYRVTQVLPFPVAKAGSDFVSYEDYLFELRHYMHYYQTQQQIDFDSEAGQVQLSTFRGDAMDTVVNNAYVKQLARENDVSVSSQEVRAQIDLLRSQNRLGGSNEVFEDVLKEFWGWSINDFERKLSQQILAQKVVSALDTETHDRAKNVLNRLNSGQDFSELAAQFSNDVTTKDQGGDYSFAIERSNRSLPPQVIDTLFTMEQGEVSGIIETPAGLEILKVREINGSRIRASHIFLSFKNIDTYIEPLRQDHAPRYFIDYQTSQE